MLNVFEVVILGFDLISEKSSEYEGDFASSLLHRDTGVQFIS